MVHRFSRSASCARGRSLLSNALMVHAQWKGDIYGSLLVEEFIHRIVSVFLVIRTQKLKKQYPKTTALKSIDITVPTGKITGLVGPNGSGKTTLIHCLLEHIDYEGTIEWQNPSAEVFYIPDENILPDLLTGSEYLLFIENIYKVKNEKMKETLITSYAMKGEMNKMIQSYSYGMKKKIQIIAGLMIHPDILILDEIFRGLDIEAILTTKRELIHYAASGRTVLLSSHDILAVEQLSAHIILLIKGEVKGQGSPLLLCQEHNKDSLESLFIHLND